MRAIVITAQAARWRTISLGARHGLALSHRRPAANRIRDLAWQKLPVAQISSEVFALDDDFSAQDRHRRPRRDLMPLPRRVVGLVQLLLADGARLAGIE